MKKERPHFLPSRIMSGGQTGVDRGALDAGMNAGIEVAGWCPAGRLAEDGEIPIQYPMMELKSGRYDDRTRKNIEDSDATLILHRGTVSGGTLLTVQHAGQRGKPCLDLDLKDQEGVGAAAEWLDRVRPARLNVAGPRESGAPGIQKEAEAWLGRLFEGARMRKG